MAKVKVKKIIDGDTFQGADGKFYRLSDINTPEKKQRGFKKAKETLEKLIGGESLIVKVEGQSYNRKVVKARKIGEKMTINTKMKIKGYKQK